MVRDGFRCSSFGGRAHRGAWAGLIGLLLFAPSACGTTAGARGSHWGTEVERRRQLPGVDTSALTAREASEWWTAVNGLDAPCPGRAVSVAQCVGEALPCAGCRPAAELVRDQILLGRSREQVEAAYRLRFDPEQVVTIDVSGSPGRGAAKPSVVIVEWSDFGCPFCARAAGILRAEVDAYPDEVRLVFKHFPLDYHPHSMEVALASVAADRQGKFWEFHDALFADRESHDPASVDKLARALRLDLARFAADRASAEARALVERDMKQADALGLSGTPFIFVNGRRFDLSVFDLGTELSPWIELEVELATGRRPRARRRAGRAANPAPQAVSPRTAEPGP
jgi:protein-disulfide isomerase